MDNIRTGLIIFIRRILSKVIPKRNSINTVPIGTPTALSKKEKRGSLSK